MSVYADDDQDLDHRHKADAMFGGHPDLQEHKNNDEDFSKWEDEIDDDHAEKELTDKQLESGEDDEADAPSVDTYESEDYDSELDNYDWGYKSNKGATSSKDFFVEVPGSGKKNPFKNRAAVVGATGIVGLILTVGGALGFLSQFRLKHLMENVNFKAFSRYNAAVDRRSDAWTRAYFRTRMMEWEGKDIKSDDGNVYFRADKVNTRNPFTDWYKTMRTSTFEDNLLKNSGIQFTSAVGPDGKIRPAIININGVKNNIFDTSDIKDFGDFTTVEDLSSSQLTQFSNRIDDKLVTFYENDRGARLAIKKAVNDETKFFQVIKRRHLRTSIQNMTGVRKWRFFDTTRTKVENKKLEFQKKFITAVTKDDGYAQTFLFCFLGMGPCPTSTDSRDPSNTRAAPLKGSNVTDDSAPEVDEKGNVINSGEKADASALEHSKAINGEVADKLANEIKDEATAISEKQLEAATIAQITKEISTKIGGGPSAIKGILDKLLKVNNNLKIDPNTGKSKVGMAVYLERTKQAIALYSLLMTMSDQMVSGEVDPDQVNSAMSYLDDIGGSEGLSYILEGSTFGAGIKQTNSEGKQVDKCINNAEPFTKEDLKPTCDNIKPNGGNAISGLQDGWNTLISNSPIGAVLTAYGNILSTVGAPLNWVTNKFNSIAEKLISPILAKIVGSIPLASELMASAGAWLSKTIMTWVGAGPCAKGTEEQAGTAVNCAIIGGISTAEISSRDAGGITLAPGDKKSATYLYSNALADSYAKDQYDSMSVGDRYFALNNHQSYASNLAFSLSINTNTRSLGKILSPTKVLGSIFSSFSKLGSTTAHAQLEIGTTDFAGVDRVDIPKVCVEDLSPDDPEYAIKATNSVTVPKDIATLGNAKAYSTALYSVQKGELTAAQSDEISRTYNCAALDNVVKGGLGFTKGFKKDDGLDDGGTVAAPVSTTTTNVKDYAWPIGPEYSVAACWNEDRSGGSSGSKGYGHSGLDIGTGNSNPVVSAPQDGDVVTASLGDNAGLGNLVIIKHPDGNFTQYQHLATIAVKVGDKVTKSTSQIGTVGSTGFSSGNHLHFNIQKTQGPNSKPGDTLNPLDFLPADNRNMTYTRGSLFADPPPAGLAGKSVKCVDTPTNPKGWVVVG
jgi:murein DD-endopeptidase MepM/ murein hydrolase activator NlpD